MNNPSIIEQALTRFLSVLMPIGHYITSTPIIACLFFMGVFVIGAKIFKRIKNSVK